MSDAALRWLDDHNQYTLSNDAHRVLYTLCREHGRVPGDLVVISEDELADRSGMAVLQLQMIPERLVQGSGLAVYQCEGTDQKLVVTLREVSR